jgi:hypothetical protein
VAVFRPFATFRDDLTNGPFRLIPWGDGGGLLRGSNAGLGSDVLRLNFSGVTIDTACRNFGSATTSWKINSASLSGNYDFGMSTNCWWLDNTNPAVNYTFYGSSDVCDPAAGSTFSRTGYIRLAARGDAGDGASDPAGVVLVVNLFAGIAFEGLIPICDFREGCVVNNEIVAADANTIYTLQWGNSGATSFVFGWGGSCTITRLSCTL